ncbi:MAG: hypothetical protein JO171_09950 [Paludibacterium sp.]|uniref:hypothetical protein n=1 Tax=Paludibacterium sp. TaxID=1917523 RepID=UPI0025F824F4|nr:hypothetical protein [Paludibacterium sp.]MBV8047467.1 hypothetical protein [Paludibacterium sp.]MBV8646735.1 hypothetical protein [Paludibacterium sp.]
MSDAAPLLICPKCCSMDIEGPSLPLDHQVLRCRSCDHTLTYAEMRTAVKAAMDDAVRLIHLRVARKLMPQQQIQPAT